MHLFDCPTVRLSDCPTVLTPFLFPPSLPSFPFPSVPSVHHPSPPPLLPSGGGNYATTLCHLYIFTAKKPSTKSPHGNHGDTGGGGGGTTHDETFLEGEEREAVNRNRVHMLAIERLEEEAARSRETRELEARLEATEIRAEMSAMLHETERSLKMKAEADRSFFMAALHEVRNPLNGIVLTVEYISDSLSHLLTPELSGELTTIETCATHQELLLKGILFLDKYISGDEELPREEFSPLQLCRDVVAMTRHSAKEGVAIVVKDGTSGRDAGRDGAAASPRGGGALTGALTGAKQAKPASAASFFVGSPTQLNLVLVNLLSNAAKFTTTGKIELTITTTSSAPDHAVFRFAVTDTGPGVPPEFQKSIFGMRSQTDDKSARVQGFGIGLFVAHELAERMGGKMVLKSPVKEGEGGTPTGGSEFSFAVRLEADPRAPPEGTSPANISRFALGSRLSRRIQHGQERRSLSQLFGEGEEGEGVEEEQTEERPVKQPSSMQGWRVLIADDSDINLRLVTRKFTSGPFKELEWQIETATTGEEALENISRAGSGRSRKGGGGEGGGTLTEGNTERTRRRSFDLVIFDEHMEPFGKLLGTEATRILRQNDDEVLIVGFTGNCAVEDQERSRESGQDLFWSKPAPPNEVALSALENALAERKRKLRCSKEEDGGRAEGGEGEVDDGKCPPPLLPGSIPVVD